MTHDGFSDHCILWSLCRYICSAQHVVLFNSSSPTIKTKPSPMVHQGLHRPCPVECPRWVSPGACTRPKLHGERKPGVKGQTLLRSVSCDGAVASTDWAARPPPEREEEGWLELSVKKESPKYYMIFPWTNPLPKAHVLDLCDAH